MIVCKDPDVSKLYTLRFVSDNGGDSRKIVLGSWDDQRKCFRVNSRTSSGVNIHYPVVRFTNTGSMQKLIDNSKSFEDEEISALENFGYKPKLGHTAYSDPLIPVPLPWDVVGWVRFDYYKNSSQRSQKVTLQTYPEIFADERQEISSAEMEQLERGGFSNILDGLKNKNEDSIELPGFDF